MYVNIQPIVYRITWRPCLCVLSRVRYVFAIVSTRKLSARNNCSINYITIHNSLFIQGINVRAGIGNKIDSIEHVEWTVFIGWSHLWYWTIQFFLSSRRKKLQSTYICTAQKKWAIFVVWLFIYKSTCNNSCDILYGGI